MTKQTKTHILSYLIDPKFNKANRLFVLSFGNEEDRTSFSKYYTAKVEMKDFNVFLDGKSFWCASKKQRRNIRKNYWNDWKYMKIFYTTINKLQ